MQPYPLEAAQQVPGSSERCPFCTHGGGDDVTEVTQLVAALDDERQGVVVVGGQLVTVQYHHLRTSHLLLVSKQTPSVQKSDDFIVFKEQAGFRRRSELLSAAPSAVTAVLVSTAHPSLCVQHLQISQQLLSLNHSGAHACDGLLLVTEPLQHLLHLLAHTDSSWSWSRLKSSSLTAVFATTPAGN